MRSSSSPMPQPELFQGKLAKPAGLVLTGLLLIATAAGLAVLALPVWPQNRGLPWGVYALLASLFVAPLAAFGAARFVNAVRYLGLRVALDDEAIEVRSWFGVRRLEWASLREFWWNADGTYLGGRSAERAVYTLVGDGRRIRLRGELIAEGGLLGPTIEKYVSRALRPATEAALRRGEEVRFGPLTVTPRGLRHAGKELTWGEIAEFELRDGGRVVVRQRQGWSVWFGEWMSRLPNLALLFGLAGERIVREGAVDDETRFTATPPVPSDATQWAASSLPKQGVAGLGAPLLVCKPRYSAWEMLAGSVLCFVLGAAAGAGTLWGWNAVGWTPQPGPVNKALAIGGPAAVFLLALGVILLARSMTTGTSVHVFANGFAVLGKEIAWVCAWDRVAKVWQDIVQHMTADGQYLRKTHRFVVERDDGVKVTVSDEVKNADRFGEEVVKRTTDRLLREATEAYHAGETLDFGEVQVSARGVRVGKKQYSWTGVTNVDLREGELHLFIDRDTVIHRAGSKVTNLAVLLALLKRLIPKKV